MAGVQEQGFEELFGGFFFDEDALSEDISLDGLEEELEEHKNYDVLVSILTNGEKQRDMATMVEGNLGHIEQDLIQDYVEDNDNLVLLHDQIHDCDIILTQIGSLLSGFQVHIGSISSEIRSLQEKSLDLGVRLKNRKLVETKLAEFVEEIVAPPGLVNVIIDGEASRLPSSCEVVAHRTQLVDPPLHSSCLPIGSELWYFNWNFGMFSLFKENGVLLLFSLIAYALLVRMHEHYLVQMTCYSSFFWQVNDGYIESLKILSKKLRFAQVDPMINASKALKDIKQELERLRKKALSKVSDYIIQIFFAMGKPGTNIQILQQNLLQKYRYLIVFLKEHGFETYNDVCAAYVDTMNKVLSAYFHVYVEALEKLKLDIGVSSDLIGYDNNIVDLITRGREHLRNHGFMFSLGERANILKEIDRPGLVPHISETNSLKYPYEVIFRSLQKLLIDTASSEYLFIEAFFGDETLFYRVFEGPFAVIDEHLDVILPNFHDAICLMLMICITRKHQLVMSNRRLPCLETYLDKVVIYLWPRFKTVFDMYLQSLYQCDAKMLWVDGTHPHHIVRCYVEFTASLVQLNAECGDGQLDMSLERLRLAVDDLLVRLAEKFANPKLQHLFLLNNYDMAISVLKEAGDKVQKLQQYFEEKLETNMMSFVVNLSSYPVTTFVSVTVVHDYLLDRLLASHWQVLLIC